MAVVVAVVVTTGLCGWRLPGAAMGGQNGGHRQHARQGGDGRLGGLAHRLHGSTPVGRDLQGKTDVAVLDHEAGNHALLDAGHACQGGADLVFSDPCHDGTPGNRGKGGRWPRCGRMRHVI